MPSRAVKVYKGAIFQNGPAPITSYVDVIDYAASPLPRAILRADISTITYTLYGSNGQALFTDVSLSPVSAYIYDTLQVGPDISFNFKVTIPASKFTTAGVYRLVFKYNLVSIDATPIVHEWELTALST